MNQTNKILLQAEISATSKGLVDALSKASSAINDTSNDWKSKFAGLKDSTSLLGQSVKNLADLVSQVGKVDMDVDGLDKINANIATVSVAFDKVKGEVDTFVTSLVDLKNAASGLGMPVEEYQRFSDAVKSSGLSMEEGVQMLQTMRQNIADFANGVPEVTDRFGQLGLTIEQLSSNTVTGNFDAIVQALQSVVQPSEQARASMEQFKTSMEHAVKVSQEYNKLLVDQTNNAYATDKDVQNAIGLSNAIGRLAEQLGVYTQSASGASNASGTASRSFEDLFNIVKGNKDVLDALAVEYANYVDSLKRGATSTLDASKALEVFETKVLKMKDALVFGDAGVMEAVPLDDIKKNLESLLEFVMTSKERIKDEMDAVRTIMEQRINAGAPVDTKELETSISHIGTLINALAELKRSFQMAGMGIPDETLSSLRDLGDYLDAALLKFQRLSEVASDTNSPMFFDDAKNAVEEFTRKLDKAREDAKRGILVHVDQTELDQAAEKLARVVPNEYAGHSQSAIDDLLSKIDQLRSKVSSHNGQVAKGLTLWQDIKRSVREYLDLLRGGNQEAGKTGNLLRQFVGQLFGVGSTVSLWVKGFREIGDFLEVVMERWVTKIAEETRKLQSILSSSWSKTAEGNQKRFEALEQEITKYMELLRKWRESGSAVDENNLRMQGRDISNKYGVDLTPETAEQQLPELFRWTHNRRKDAIESQIKSLEELNSTLEGEFKELDSYVKSELGHSTREKNENQRRMVEIRKEQGLNDDRIMELRAQLRLLGRETKLEDMYLTERARAIDAEKAKQREQPIGRWGVGNIDLYDRPLYRNEDGSISTVDSMSFRENGKEVLIPTIARDSRGNATRLTEQQAIFRYHSTGEYLGKFDTVAEANDYAERLHKEQEERVNALERANTSLQDWGNSLTDNDRQKELREIIDKYNSLVQEGVNAEEARIVATKAIEAILQKEKEEEEKHNRELLQALQDRIDQYKSAYQAYLASERDLQEARREERELIKQQNRDRRAESLQRQRDRIQKRLSRFGFTPYEGFRLDESETRRARRKRNVELDASISEKMERSKAGERVSWSPQERQRILEYQRLQRRDKSLEAAQKQMNAAEKQRQAANTMKEAAKSISNAIAGRDESIGNLRGRANDLRGALGNRPVTSNYGRADQLFLNAMRNGLNARGVSGAWSQTQGNYNQQLNQLHTDLQAIGKNVYVVR